MKRLLQKLRAWLSRFLKLRKAELKISGDLVELVNKLGISGQDGGYEVRDTRPHCEIAYEALIRRGSVVVPALVSVLTGQWEYRPIQARVYHGTANYRDIYSYEQQPDPLLVQKLAIRLSGGLRDSRAADALVHILRSPASQLEHRIEACQALGRIGAGEAVKPLQKELAEAEMLRKAIQDALMAIKAGDV